MEHEIVLEKDENLLLVNDGKELGIIKLIDELPSYSEKANPDAIAKLNVLAGESFKAIANIPGKTLEVVFNPNIEKGLKDGTYTLLKKRNGELLADAIHKDTGKIVGKGIVKSNMPKQIASAGFQLLSVVVAQAHLADISDKLGKIEELCRDIKKDRTIAHISRMEADMEYLQGIIKNIEGFPSPEKISEQQKNHIEFIIKNLIEYKISLLHHFRELIKKIENQKDKDNFGSENTYNELFLKQESYSNLIQQMELINKIYILLKLITGYYDPLNKVFSRINLDDFFLDLREHQRKYLDSIQNSVHKFFKSVTFNASDTLKLRKNSLVLTANVQNNLFERIEDCRNNALNKLNSHLASLSKPNSIRYALKFDKNGEIESASLV